MPGNGTFNLTALWRALGIKNPQASVSERIQPVMLVSDLSALTPLHRPPTGAFGSDIPPVVGETAMWQFQARAPGGCVILYAGTGSVLNYRTGLDLSGDLAPVAPGAILSAEPPETAVFKGNSATLPGVSDDFPILLATSFTVFPPNVNATLFVPAGENLIFWRPSISTNLVDTAWIVQDVPASEIRQQ